MASSIDRLRKTRGVVRSGVTRALNQLNDLLQQPSPDAATLSSHVDYIVQQDAELTALNGKIAEATDDDALEQELEGAAEYNRKVSYAVSRARFLLRNAQPNAPVASESGAAAASAHDTTGTSWTRCTANCGDGFERALRRYVSTTADGPSLGRGGSATFSASTSGYRKPADVHSSGSV
ncbi:hypothetical protein HPB48_005281 [Haemaphysalis longicornis]|uniref:Uncharacterized protein n=1 Tax=Haemaphysalis longicornis TaxID=44386 RepID=A0A9J6GSU1_HAELO|nr:hypothetical protein HPB48_005281 [Haemaphysalis longicornis]